LLGGADNHSGQILVRCKSFAALVFYVPLLTIIMLEGLKMKEEIAQNKIETAPRPPIGFDCDAPLLLFVILSTIRIFIETVFSLGTFISSFTPFFFRRFVAFTNQSKDLLEFASFVLFIMGNMWILQSENCSPHLTHCAVLLLSVSYITFLFPCFLLTAMLCVVCLCLPSFLRFMQYFGIDLRLESDNQENERPPLCTQEMIDQYLPSKVYSTMSSALSDRDPSLNSCHECPICLVPFKDNDVFRTLSCSNKHMFHKDCIDRWLTQHNNNCPTCRTVAIRRNEVDVVID